MRRSVFRRGTVLVTLAIIIGLLAVPVTAQVSIDVDTSYDGTEGDNEQAIKINVTIEPEIVTDNLAVTVFPSDEVVVDPDTYNSPQPAVDQPIANRFEVEEIEPGETIVVTFKAYPKSLQNSEVLIGNIRVTSDQLTEPETETIRENISSNPLLELRNAEEQISELEADKESLEQDVDDIEQWRRLGQLLALVGVVVAVGGVGGAYVWRKRSIEDERDKTFAELESMSRSLDRLDGKEHQGYEDGRDDARSKVNETISRLAERWNREWNRTTEQGPFDPGVEDLDDDTETEDLDGELPDLDE